MRTLIFPKEVSITFLRTNFQTKSSESTPWKTWGISLLINAVTSQIPAKTIPVFNFTPLKLTKPHRPSGCRTSRRLTVSCVTRSSGYSAGSITVAVVAPWSAGSAPLPRCTCMGTRIRRCACVRRARMRVRRGRGRLKRGACLCLRGTLVVTGKSRLAPRLESRIKTNSKKGLVKQRNLSSNFLWVGLLH